MHHVLLAANVAPRDLGDSVPEWFTSRELLSATRVQLEPRRALRSLASRNVEAIESSLRNLRAEWSLPLPRSLLATGAGGLRNRKQEADVRGGPGRE